MAQNSKIEWTDHTWNPTVGCSIVSPGCTNCYAMQVAHGLERRFDSPKYRGLTKVVNGNAVWTGEVRLDEAALLQPLTWKKGRRIFVNSMSDLFHESLSDETIDKVLAVIALTPQHTYQLLTKRPERMRAYFNGPYPDGNGVCARIADATWALAPDRKQLPEPPVFVEVPVGPRLANGEPEFGFRRMMHPKRWPLPNLWLGISCERQQEADERIPLLLQTPAAVRFISAEPLLGPIDLGAIEAPDKVEGERWTFNALTTGDYYEQWSETCLGEPRRSGSDGPNRDHKLDWVIVGGESGPNARPMNPQWARDIRDACAEAGIAYFHKQNGEYASVSEVEGDGAHFHFPDGRTVRRVGKKRAGRLLEGREHNEFPSTDGRERA